MFCEESTTVIAHRGASGHVPENTMPAFERALEMGAEAFELDLQLTADGHVVVIHDPFVDRVTESTGPVRAHTLAELKTLDAGHHFAGSEEAYPFRGQGVQVPILDEVLEAFPDTPIIMDMKTGSGEAIVPALARVIERHRAQDRVVVGSFDSRYLERLRALLPGVQTGFGRREVRNFYLLNLCRLHHWSNPSADMLLVPERVGALRLVSSGFVRAAEALNLDVHVWTIEDTAGMRRLVRRGVDGIMTGFPDRLVSVLSERKKR